ncbi:hypothetical protein SEVIR_2G269332v4 [Setaria viridis]
MQLVKSTASSPGARGAGRLKCRQPAGVIAVTARMMRLSSMVSAKSLWESTAARAHRPRRRAPPLQPISTLPSSSRVSRPDIGSNGRSAAGACRVRSPSKNLPERLGRSRCWACGSAAAQGRVFFSFLGLHKVEVGTPQPRHHISRSGRTIVNRITVVAICIHRHSIRPNSA